MPRIQTYEQRVQAAGPLSSRLLQPATQGFAGANALGSTITDIGGMLAQQEERKQAFEAEKFAAEEAGNLKQFLEDEKRTAPEGAPQFTQSFREKLAQRQSKILEGFTGGEAARRSLELSMVRMNSALVDDAARFEATAYGEKQKKDLQNIFSKNENIVFADPKSLGLVLESEMKLIDKTEFWDAGTRAAVAQDRKVSVYNKALDGRVTAIATNPNASLGQVNAMIREMEKGDVWNANASPQQFEQSLTALKQLRENLTQKTQQQLFADFEEQMDKTQITGVRSEKYTPDWIKANVQDPVMRERMLKKESIASAVGDEMVRIRTAPATDMAKDLSELDRMATLSQSGTFHKDLAVYEARAKAWQMRNDMWNKDPAGFINQSSAPARAAFDKLMKEGTPEAADFYAQTAMVEQQKLYPGTAPVLLTADQIGAVKSQFEAIEGSEDGAAQATDLIQKMQATWGKHWPVVVKDLRAAKALNETQYVAATLFDNPQKKGLAEMLMVASSQKDSELLKTIPGGSTTQTAIRENAVAALQPLLQTLQDTDGGFEIYQSYTTAIEKTLLYKSAMQGRDLSGEVEDLANQLINDAYEFKGSYRIPRNVGPGADNAVEVVKEKYLRSPDLISPPSLVLTRDADVQERYRSNVQAFSRVVNMRGDAGIRIVDQEGKTLMRKTPEGEAPMEWTWQDLLDEAETMRQENLRGMGFPGGTLSIRTGQ